MQTNRKNVFSLLSLGVVLALGGAECLPPGTDTPDASANDDLDQAIADFCEQAVMRCVDKWGTSGSKENCAKLFKSMVDCPAHLNLGSIAVEMKFTLSASALRDCTAQISALGCDAYDEGVPACDKIMGVVGGVQVGQSCSSTATKIVSCDSNLQCVHSATDGECSVCRARGQAGAACGGAADPDCDKNLFCDGSGHCAATKADAAACVSATECKSRYCHASVCTKAPAKGESCGDNNYCGGNLRCDAALCVDKKDEGASCQADGECIGMMKCSNQRCTYLDYCSRPAAGAACLVECAAGAYCESGLCKAYVALGAPCTTNTECGIDKAFCDSTRKCVAYLGIGATCGTADLRCNPFGSFCDIAAAPVCVAQLADNATCANDSQCASFFCDTQDKCAAETCTMP